MPNIDIHTLVLVQWCDAESQDDWSNEDDVDKWIKDKNFLCQEIGWVLEDSKDMLVLTSQIGQGNLIGNRTKIPKPWIVNKRIIKLKDIRCRKRNSIPKS